MKRKKIVITLFVLIATTATVLAQGYRFTNRPGRSNGCGYRYNNYGNGYQMGRGNGYGIGCGYQAGSNYMSSIKGLTEKQQSQITEIVEKHIKKMAELHIELNRATDLSERNKIHDKMLKTGLSRREEIRNILNEEQQEQFDILQEQRHFGSRGFGRGRRCGRGNRGYAGWSDFTENDDNEFQEWPDN